MKPTDAVIARYSTGSDRKHLLIVKYADEQKATEAFMVFAKAFSLQDCRTVAFLALTIPGCRSPTGNIIAAFFRAASSWRQVGCLQTPLKELTRQSYNTLKLCKKR
jgi:hypothetical protein